MYVTDPRDPSIAACTAPDADTVPVLMTELVNWLNTDSTDHPLVRAAMAHLQLVSIHPWADGNGRMSRSLQTLMIAREGVLAPELSSIEAWLGRPGNTWEYYRELNDRGATYSPDQDVAGWIRFNLTAYHQQSQTVQGRLDRSGRVWTALSGFAQNTGLDQASESSPHGGETEAADVEQADTVTDALARPGRSRSGLLAGCPAMCCVRSGPTMRR